MKSNNAEVVKHGLDERLLSKLRAILNDVGDDTGTTTTTTYIGYTRASVAAVDGEVINYNAYPFLLGFEWYDWAYVYYKIMGPDGRSNPQFYPLKILGFKQHNNELKAVILCSVDTVPWSELEKHFVVQFTLCEDEGEEQIIPLSALFHPLCVVPDNGADKDEHKYLMVLPKGQWSGYFSRFVQSHMN